MAEKSYLQEITEKIIPGSICIDCDVRMICVSANGDASRGVLECNLYKKEINELATDKDDNQEISTGPGL
jgi:hypothetical protein